MNLRILFFILSASLPAASRAGCIYRPILPDHFKVEQISDTESIYAKIEPGNTEQSLPVGGIQSVDWGSCQFTRVSAKPFWKWPASQRYEKDGYPPEFVAGIKKLAAQFPAGGLCTNAKFLGEFNERVNQAVVYMDDKETHGTADFWQSPTETLQRRTGDCEDSALLKYGLLKDIFNCPLEDVRVGIVRDTNRNVAHAVLLVKSSQTSSPLVLNNGGDRTYSWDEANHFKLYYVVSERGVFVPQGQHCDKATVND